MEFTSDPWFQQKHTETNSEYIRTWLAARWYLESSFPLRADGSYDWSKVDPYVDAVLNTGATPIINFAHGDRCGARGEFTTPFDFSRCQAHGSVPPSNNAEFIQYVETVVQHFVNRYGASEVNTWYFEMWNEPTGSIWWSGQYYALFSLFEPAVRAIVPGAMIGGTGSDLGSYGADWTSKHWYPNNIRNINNDQDRMDSIDTMYSQIRSLKQSSGIEVINGEYHVDTGNNAYQERPFIGDWFAAAFIAQIKAGLNIELTYRGTCGKIASRGTGCRGAWATDKTLLGLYYKKKAFTEIVPYGSLIYPSTEESGMDVLATESNGQKYVVMVNKQGSSTTRTVQLQGMTATQLVDVESGQTIPLTNGQASITFGSFESKLFRVEGTGGGGCSDTSWTPNPSTVCSGSSFTQTSNCGNTRQVTGTKDCTTCTDTSWTPNPSTVCSGSSFSQTSNCGTTRSSMGTQTCGGGGSGTGILNPSFETSGSWTSTTGFNAAYHGWYSTTWASDGSQSYKLSRDANACAVLTTGIRQDNVDLTGATTLSFDAYKNPYTIYFLVNFNDGTNTQSVFVNPLLEGTNTVTIPSAYRKSGVTLYLAMNEQSCPGSTQAQNVYIDNVRTDSTGSSGSGADTNGDGTVSNGELLSYITSWISGGVTNQDLLSAITAWVQG